jgi:hypothetical protein
MLKRAVGIMGSVCGAEDRDTLSRFQALIDANETSRRNMDFCVYKPPAARQTGAGFDYDFSQGNVQ